MVGQILGTDKIAHDLENIILEKTEGIPFFIEEFINPNIALIFQY